jgi:hypothetical protein
MNDRGVVVHLDKIKRLPAMFVNEVKQLAVHFPRGGFVKPFDAEVDVPGFVFVPE